jgi:DNA-binding XRE family transcriptional regulator
MPKKKNPAPLGFVDGLRRAEEAPTMKRIIRDRRLTPEEAAKYKALRERVAEELPELIARHNERMASLDQLQEVLVQLKAAREAKGLSLSDLTELTGMDRSALSKLENGQRANPTVETLVRYAEAVGKRLVVALTDVGP